MPIYEYTCRACGARVSLFFRSISSVTDPKCDRCGSSDLERLMSRVTVLRSAGDMSSLDDDSMMAGFDENDPKAMAEFFDKLAKEHKSSKADEWFSNHPIPENRVAKVNEEINRIGPPLAATPLVK